MGQPGTNCVSARRRRADDPFFTLHTVGAAWKRPGDLASHHVFRRPAIAATTVPWRACDGWRGGATDATRHATDV